MNKTLSIFFAIISSAVSIFGQAGEKLQKLTAEEILSKHAASIGTPDAIAAAKTRVMVGDGVLSLQVGGTGVIGGPAQIATEGNKFLFVMILNGVNYPYEKIGYDGKELTVGRPSGRRTSLAEFLKANSGIVKDGLMGGTLSAAWPLLPNAPKKLKFQSAGTLKIGGKDFYKIEYIPSGGGSNAVLVFEPDNFRHVMSEYTVSLPPKFGDQTHNAQAKRTYYTLTERFSNFGKAGELVLPLNYTLDYSLNEGETAQRSQWNVRIKEVYYNEELDPAVFRVS
jgi:hypothetical protein